MNYLLLNGTTTKNLNVYIRDVLFLNFKTLPSEIPFNTQLGLQRYILDDSTLDYTDKVRNSITDLLERLNSRHGIVLTLIDLTLDNSKLSVKIKLEDDSIESYEIPTLNI
mgnify:CR=1 FL=1|jgi:hypothetical protein